MANDFISGNDSYVKLGVVAYQFNKWRLPIDGGTKKFFAFGSSFQRTLPGGKSAQPQVSGPYDAGNMPLAVGVVYELHLGWAVGLELVVSARVSNIDYSSEVSAGGEPGQCSVTFESEGSFTVSFT